MSRIVIPGQEPEGEQITPADYATAKMIAEHLEKHYPEWRWMVYASSEKGIVFISSALLSGKIGFTLKYPSFENDPSLKAVTLAGGEILERYRFKTSRMIEDDLAIRKVIAGDIAFDYQGMKNGKASKLVKARWDQFK